MKKPILALAILLGVTSAVFAETKTPLSVLMKQAQSGDAQAQLELAARYQNGDGVAKDERSAFQWTKHAAEDCIGGCYVPAWLFLGIKYTTAVGTEPDIIESYKWFHLAAKKMPKSYPNYDELLRVALEDRASLSMTMTPAQILEAEIRAELWWTKTTERFDTQNRPAN